MAKILKVVFIYNYLVQLQNEQQCSKQEIKWDEISGSYLADPGKRSRNLVI
jgi:hypothetical protein